MLKFGKWIEKEIKINGVILNQIQALDLKELYFINMKIMY